MAVAKNKNQLVLWSKNMMKDSLWLPMIRESD